MKPPYTTNREAVTFVTSFEDLIAALARLSFTYYSIFSYVMIQPKMINRTELKVAVTNGKAQYIVKSPNKPGLAISHAPHTDLFAFAEQAVAMLKERCPALISDGLLRVDIFKNKNGSYVVNEFESLEAVYYSRKEHYSEIKIDEFLVTYWMKKIYSQLKFCNK